MPNDVAKIKGVQSRYVAACNADDIDVWQTILANDFVFMPPDAPKVSGKKAAAAWCKGAFFDPFKMKTTRQTCRHKSLRCTRFSDRFLQPRPDAQVGR